MSTQAESDLPTLPLFYRQPEPLTAAAHGDWRIRGGDLRFAETAHVVPLVVSEFVQAARFYPILFTTDGAAPVALLGLERRNLFVSDGAWQPRTYVPAYVRRYPFGFMALREPGRFALAIDAASEAIGRGEGEGEPLFADGAPSPLTQEALKFCDAYQGEAAGTDSFRQALVARDLLVDRRAEVTLPDGRKFAVEGFQLVDPTRLAALDAETVVDWQARGWLALVHFHLMSLDRFSDLLSLQDEQANPLAAQ